MNAEKPIVHLLDVPSLRGPEYEFRIQNELPDATDNHARRVYMDSFIRCILPVGNETLGQYRANVTIEYLNYLVQKRYIWVAEEWLNFMIDSQLWEAVFKMHDEIKQMPEFPWKLVRHDTSKEPSTMYQDWRLFHYLDSDTTGSFMDKCSTDKELKETQGMHTFESLNEFLRDSYKENVTGYGLEPTKVAQGNAGALPISNESGSAQEISPHATPVATTMPPNEADVEILLAGSSSVEETAQPATTGEGKVMDRAGSGNKVQAAV